MNKTLLKSFLVCLSVSFTGLIIADDTEIYTTIDDELANSDETNPNVLFILDSSGSMGGTLGGGNVPERYNGSNDYTSHINTVKGDYYVYDLNNNWTGYYLKNKRNNDGSVAAEKQNCKAAHDWFANNPNYPRYVGQFIYRRIAVINGVDDRRWQVFDENFETKSNNRQLECKADAGVHGDADGNPTRKPYANKNTQSWTADPNKQIRFGSKKFYLVPANYHGYRIAYNNNALPLVAPSTKLALMQETVINQISKFEDINFGMMRFTYNNNYIYGYGGLVIQAIEPIIDRQALVDKVKLIGAEDHTPLAKSMYEAYLYFKGDTARYGRGDEDSDTDPEAYTDYYRTYKSPVKHSCQKNYVIMLSDGAPYSDGGDRDEIAQLTGTTCNTDRTYSNNQKDASYSCLDELTHYLYRTDLFPNLDGLQNIVTHTIGFGIDPDVLQKAATAPVNGYQNASSSVALDNAFAQALASISSTSDSFVAPAVPISSYNSLQNSDELYFSLFKPSTTTRWDGNIKRYRITSSAEIVDVRGNSAINEQGLIRDDARSYWSEVQDGSEVSLGGVAQQMTLPRKLYTFIGDNPTNVSLSSSPAYELSKGNNLITRAHLNAVDNDARNLVLEWARGVDVETGSNAPHEYIGDPLHSRPVIINYNDSTSRLFYSTNLGFLYGHDSRTGDEKFGFIPEELLDNLAIYYQNTSYDLATSKPYGIDGEIAVWIDDVNLDGKIDPNTDKVMLFTGMRRGGSSYYAFDVTNPDSPKLAWRIHPGRSGFGDLGQTWSKPIVSKVKWGCNTGGECTDKTVLFFGGGYDNTLYDTRVNYINNEQRGDAIYMVDALTGDLLWSAGSDGFHSMKVESLTGSIPSNIGVLDVNADGFADILMAITIQGYYFRFDLNKDASNANNFATAYEIANFSPRNPGANDTNIARFYNGPDVALHRTRGRATYFTIATTTGNRSRPKSQPDTDNHVIVLYENDVFVPRRSSSGSAELSDLKHIEDLVGDTTASPSSSKGWYHTFSGDKEKGLSPTLTFNSRLIFGTYLPSRQGGPTVDLCSGNIGSSRAYQIDVNTGASSLVDDNGVRQPFEQLNQQGIPPAPVVIIIGEETTVGGNTQVTNNELVCIGPACDLADGDGNLKKIYWRELSPYFSPDQVQQDDR